jgi:predicted esterase
VPGDGVTLASWYFPNPRHERCAVIMLHGFGSAKARTRIDIPAWPAPQAESFLENPAAYTKLVDHFLQEFKLPPGPRRGA